MHQTAFLVGSIGCTNRHFKEDVRTCLFAFPSLRFHSSCGMADRRRCVPFPDVFRGEGGVAEAAVAATVVVVVVVKGEEGG
ncbi:hypothetical protein E2C01_063870 [Portunus trituberculatus]|uniref:Uncharacterized protein n=1 Tax=Portunus trituberculatus TaxID=210409 RepID=A0A5B7HBN4_PORTR|nr:hypothetical protein [Portunus trituberculatus]